MKHKFRFLIKKELFSYAIHPFYYVASIVFCAFCAAGFFFAGHFFIEGKGSSSLSRFFLLMPYIASVFIPSLCIDTKSRALSATLPYSARALFLSRVVSALLVFALAILPTALVPLCVNFFGDVDGGALFTAYLGILFFAFASISLCVFLSELIQNRAAYFFCSVLVLSAINVAHFLPTLAPLSEFSSALVRSFSFAWHFDSAGKGVLDTRDFLFYVFSATLFVELSVFTAETRKGKNYFSGKNALPTLTFSLILMFAALDSSRVYKRFDLSRSKQFSLSPYTKNLISSASEKIRITYYRSPELLSLYPEVREVGFFLQSLALENKNVSFAELDPARRGEEKNLNDLGIQPYQIQSIRDNRVEFIDTYSAVVLEYLEGVEVIPLAFSTNSLEFDVALRLDFLLNKTRRKAYALCGGDLDLERDCAVSLQWLNLEGFEIVPVSDARILAEADGSSPLVLYGTKNLSQEDSAAVENFILRGGAALIMTSPYSANVDGDWGISENPGDTFIPVLEKWGAAFDHALAADISNVRASFYSASSSGQNSPNEYKYVNYPLWINLLPQENAPAGLAFFWASPIRIARESAEPIFFTSDSSWVFLPDTRGTFGASLFETNPFTIPKAAPEDSEFSQKCVSALGAKITGKISGLYNSLETAAPRVVLVSGEHFASDALLAMAGGEAGDFRNLHFLGTELLRLNGENDLAELKNSFGSSDAGLYKITSTDEAASAIRKTLAIQFLLMPLAILSAMALFFVARNHRRRKSALYFQKQGGGK